MDPYFSLLWLLDGSQITSFGPTQLVSTQFTRILPADPMRFSLIVPQQSTQGTLYAFSESTPTFSQFQIPANAGLYKLTRLEIGQLITLPLWAFQAAGTPYIGGVTVSFLPHKYARYLEYVNATLP